jgi:hypothetical protein
VALTVLNSFCFDYALRLRTAGTNVSFTYILPVAVPATSQLTRIPQMPTQLSWRRGVQHISLDSSVWAVLWEANKAVAEAYGLDANDFAHVLAAFPGFARKRPGLHAYFLERVDEWLKSGT